MAKRITDTLTFEPFHGEEANDSFNVGMITSALGVRPAREQRASFVAVPAKTRAGLHIVRRQALVCIGNGAMGECSECPRTLATGLLRSAQFAESKVRLLWPDVMLRAVGSAIVVTTSPLLNHHTRLGQARKDLGV